MAEYFNQLRQFILHDMRMTHIYQPVMLLEILERGGAASVREIAESFAKRDPTQVEYYEHITKRYPGPVLTKNRGITVKDGNTYALPRFAELSESEVNDLMNCCLQRLDEFLDKRGQRAWQHRSKSSGYISGSIKYRVLKAARFRCQLCGIPADQKALEVDHILPRSKGGSDELHNFQALCYSCNAMKNNQDDEDLREVASSYNQRDDNCVFCELPQERIVEQNELAIAFQDLYPVTPLHTLVIPKRHVADYFSLHQPERNAIQQLLESQREAIREEDPLVSGFNVGVNAGKSAGQTVFHCHFHLIPRRDGDMEDPRGGVRGVVPGKQRY